MNIASATAAYPIVAPASISSLTGALLYRQRRGAVAYDAICLPQGDESWSLEHFYGTDAAARQPRLALRLSRLLEELGIERAYAPSVGHMSGTVVGARQLLMGTKLPGGTAIFRQKGLPGDGVPLEKGDAFVMSQAGCPLVVATGGGYLIAAHAGRDSLLDRRAIVEGVRREHEGVIYAIAAEFAKLGISSHEVVLEAFFSIAPEAFGHPLGHPVHGRYNCCMVRWIEKRWGKMLDGIVTVKDGVAYLDLPKLIFAQAKAVGFHADLDERWGGTFWGDFDNFASTRSDAPRARNLIIARRVA